MEMKERYKSLVIIPAYNEERHIAYIVARIRWMNRCSEVLVIDDGSSDMTARKARFAGARVISHLFNMGYGVALQTGYKYAFEKDYDFLVQMDADGQHHPAYIPKMIDILEKKDADLVIGSRFIYGMMKGNTGLCRYSMDFSKRLGVMLFSFVTTKITGIRVTDPTSGYQALNRKAIGLFIQDFFPNDYPDSDMIITAHRSGLKVKEFPMIMFENRMGRSMHAGLKPVYYTFKMFLSLFMIHIRKRHMAALCQRSVFHGD
ncbi:glycosyltransferase family 2 protein [bacterium]|nr:glycosyltransferase family 2 protein [bacterium]